MDLILVNQFEVVVVRRLMMSFPTILVIPSAITSLTPISTRRKILSVGFVLGAAVVCDLWIDGAVVGADKIGGRS